MSADLEERLRAALQDAPEPPGAIPRARRAALDRLAERPRPRRRASAGRWLGRLATAVGACAVVTILALLIIASPSEPPATPADATGVEYVLRAVPYADGLTPEAAAERLAEVLRARGERRGVTGMTVRAEGDRVLLFVPRTHDVDWARTLLQGLDVAVYDTTGSVAATAQDPAAAVQQALRREPADGPERYYLVARGPTVAQTFLGGPYATRAEADADGASSSLGRPARVIAAPAAITPVLTNDPVGAMRGAFIFAVLRDPVVAAGQIADIRADGDVLAVVVVPEARETVAARVVGLDGGGALLIAAGTGTPQTFNQARFERYDAEAGELLFTAGRGTATFIARELGPRGAEVGAVTEAARPVGPPPERAGVRPATLPEFFARQAEVGGLPDESRPRLDTVRRVIEMTRDGRTRSVWAYQAENGGEMVASLGDADGVGAGGCPIAPDFPVALVCLTEGAAGETRFVGRVGEAVATLRAEYADGTSVDATVANGYFLLVLPLARGVPTGLVARDATGAEIGGLDATASGGSMVAFG